MKARVYVAMMSCGLLVAGCTAQTNPMTGQTVYSTPPLGQLLGLQNPAPTQAAYQPLDSQPLSPPDLYEPESFVKCRNAMRSQADLYACYEHQIAKLDGRLPPGSAGWKAEIQRECARDQRQWGEAGQVEALDCEMQETAKKVGAV